MALVVKNLPGNAEDTRDLVLISGLGKSLGWGHHNPLQYVCLENPHKQRSLWGLQSIGSHRVKHNWIDMVWTHTKFMFQCYPPNLSHHLLLQPCPHSWVFFFFYIEFYELFVILQINSLFVVSFASIFSHSVRCLFVSFIVSFWRRQWQPTPVLLPGKSHGRSSLVGCRSWGR